MKFISFNLNNLIRFKPTDDGWKILKDSLVYLPKINEGGFVEMQMWEFINIYGGHFKWGGENPMFMNVEINVSSEEIK